MSSCFHVTLPVVRVNKRREYTRCQSLVIPGSALIIHHTVETILIDGTYCRRRLNDLGDSALTRVAKLRPLWTPPEVQETENQPIQWD